MSISDAVAILGLLWVVGQWISTLFVSHKIGKAKDAILEKVEDRYLPREVAAEKFRYYDRYLGDSETTPLRPRRAIAPDDE